MNCFCAFWKSVWRAIRRIHLVDRCLIIIMAILMAQSAYNLFANEAGPGDTNHIDVIVRTSAAAIFGYFISVNFIKKRNPPDEQTAADEQARTLDSGGSAAAPRARIGFTSPGGSADAPPPGGAEPGTARLSPYERRERITCERTQIVVVSAVGVTSLCVLLLFRNLCVVTASSLGTISQLRDFVSGCVGFLIGCATDGAED